MSNYTGVSELDARSYSDNHGSVMAPKDTYDQGRVADYNTAEEMAYIEKPGRDNSLALQEELQRQAESGLDDKEKAMYEVMTALKDRYPDGIIEKIDSKGRKFLLLQPRDYGTAGSAFIDVVTKDGAYSVNFDAIGGFKNVDAVNWAHFTDSIKERNFLPGRTNNLDVDKELVVDNDVLSSARQTYLSIYTRDLTSDTGLDIFKKELVEADERGMKRSTESKLLEAQRDPKNIISKLL